MSMQHHIVKIFKHKYGFDDTYHIPFIAMIPPIYWEGYSFYQVMVSFL